MRLDIMICTNSSGFTDVFYRYYYQNSLNVLYQILIKMGVDCMIPIFNKKDSLDKKNFDLIRSN